MRYISTRGQAPARDFADVLLAGLAEDGGLFVPETWPAWSHGDIRALRGLPYAELAARVMQPFTGNAVPFATLQGICRTPMPGSPTRRWRRWCSWTPTSGPWSCSTAPRSPSRTWRCRCWGACLTMC